MNGKIAALLSDGFPADTLCRAVDLYQSSHWKHILSDEGWNSWTGIALLSKDGELGSLGEGSQYYPTSLLRSSAEFQEVLAYFKCPLHRVRVLKLDPNHGQIHEHVDEMPESHRLARLQLPLSGAADTYFYSVGERVPMQEGELWYIDVTLPHSVVNQGKVERLSMVIDCELNDWLENLINSSNFTLNA